MHRIVPWLPLFLLLPATLGASPAPIKLSLKTSDGAAWSLDDCKDKKAIVVLFIGTQCPVNNAYMPKLVEMEKEYREKGVQFVAINSNEHDSPEAINKHAKRFGLTFPVLRDEIHRVAELFGAERHPMAFVLDAQRKVRYEGRIDDRYGVGYDRGKPTRRDLVEALDEVLAGKEVSTPKTPVEGCFLTKRPRSVPAGVGVTYAKDVARVLQDRCQECHRPGQIGPMPLLTYEDASAWAQMIREVVDDGRMPPWHADPKHGPFSNDRRLTKDERTRLLAWIDAGCPRGDDKDLPAAKKFAAGWNIGQPDVVFTMPQAFTVPARAKGGVPYKYFVVPTNFTEDKWIQAVEAKPGNNAVVHHIIVYVFENGKRMKSLGDDIGSGMLVPYAPGDRGAVYPASAGKRIPKGAALVFQMHYTPNGVEQSDRSSLAMIFAKDPPKSEIKTRSIAQRFLLIPPNTDNHKAVSKTTFEQDVIVYGLFPHMHLRGKSFQFEAIYPDGKRETLLTVPRYDFGWQTNYVLREPLHLPAKTRVECTAYFDNSSKNPNNPDPTSVVFWGEQTWQEMMIGFVDYALDVKK